MKFRFEDFTEGFSYTQREMDRAIVLRRYRASLILFMAGLVASGVTAFPLLAELKRLCLFLGISPTAAPASYAGLSLWIAIVHHGLDQTYAAFPWIAYGTDWLAFAHVVIALFFIGPLVEPVKNRWVLYVGLACCAAVFPLALIAGGLRGIPVYWRLLDCSFGFFGALPLLYCLRLSGRLAASVPGDTPVDNSSRRM